MNDEDALLQAVRSAPHDDAVRLVYADWLEEHGDPRADYLRLQCELKQRWSYTDPCVDLYTRLTALQCQLDPAWLALVRRFTTPPPPVDVVQIAPELKGKERTSVLLHPRRGHPTPESSHIGGSFLWPAGEELPTCPVHEGQKFVEALQLRKEDFPELDFPADMDLFQMVWCHESHPQQQEHPEQGPCPIVQFYWRRRSTFAHALAPVQPTNSEQYILPSCLLYPERVLEYPNRPYVWPPRTGLAHSELQRGLDLVCGLPAARSSQERRKRIWDDDLFVNWLGPAERAKVVGSVGVAPADTPMCACGTAMQPLLMIPLTEKHLTGAQCRWCPIEDREDQNCRDYPDYSKLSIRWCWEFDDGKLVVFSCRSCAARPIRYLIHPIIEADDQELD